MASIFNRLSYNFDSTKFGDAIDPTGKLEEDLTKIPSIMLKWQYDAIANNDVSGYLQNPVANITLQIKSNANSMLSISSNVANLETIVSATQNLAGYVMNTGDEENPVYVPIEGECDKFKSHTDRISGVTSTTSPTLPDFSSGIGVGEIILMLTNKYDGIVNNTPILGTFTSLFIEPDLIEKNIILNTDIGIVSNSIYTIEEDDGAGNTWTSYYSNLSSSQLSTIVSNIVSIKNLMETRRTHDVTFYNNANAIVNDYQKMSQFSRFTPLKLHLIENYVGTNKLKNEL